MGRFINADAYTSTGQGILGNNMFVYCRNNAVCRIDISGTADTTCLDETDDLGMEKEDAGRPNGAYDTSTTSSSATNGQVVGNIITGYTKHGLDQASGRQGVGVKPSAILDAVRNPVSVVSKIDHLGRESIQYKGVQSTVVLNPSGEIISCWAKSSQFWRTKN